MVIWLYGDPRGWPGSRVLPRAPLYSLWHDVQQEWIVCVCLCKVPLIKKKKRRIGKDVKRKWMKKKRKKREKVHGHGEVRDVHAWFDPPVARTGHIPFLAVFSVTRLRFYTQNCYCMYTCLLQDSTLTRLVDKELSLSTDKYAWEKKTEYFSIHSILYVHYKHRSI